MNRIGVVIPARNEEALLPRCLDAIERAARMVTVPVRVVVVLDACTDRSHAIASVRPDVTVVRTAARNVGVARALGTADVLNWATPHPLSHLWLATTDADSCVPPDWLVRQLDLAHDGWEVVVGTVTVNDWSEHEPTVPRRWAGGYQATEHHPHIHGANLGFSATAYLQAGGWPALAVGEDVALVAAMAHRRVSRTATLPVVTSARRQPRAAGGFGDAVAELAG